MKISEVVLPSNKKFGYFFSLVFVLASIYFYFKGIYFACYLFGLLALLFFFISLIYADLLLTFNKIWMSFGLLIGMIISPILLGVLFFFIFTPIAIISRLFGRDELNLRTRKATSKWTDRNTDIDPDSFRNQF
jgi:predicted membrane protein